MGALAMWSNLHFCKLVFSLMILLAALNSVISSESDEIVPEITPLSKREEALLAEIAALKAQLLDIQGKPSANTQATDELVVQQGDTGFFPQSFFTFGTFALIRPTLHGPKAHVASSSERDVKAELLSDASKQNKK